MGKSNNANADIPDVGVLKEVEAMDNCSFPETNENDQPIKLPKEETKKNDDNSIGEVKDNEDMETEHNQFMEMMKQPKEKWKIYFIHKPLHQLFFKEPLNYEDFKIEYKTYKDKLNSMKDPNSIDGKRHLEDKNRLKYWDSLFSKAQKKMPHISPLYSLPFTIKFIPYVRIEINGVNAVAIIDTGIGTIDQPLYVKENRLKIVDKVKMIGADVSWMSSWLAKKAGFEHAIDKQYQTELSGVGGLVKTRGHIKCSFDLNFRNYDALLEVFDCEFDLVIGLDFIRHHNCKIDFPRKRFIFHDNDHLKMLSCTEIYDYFKTREAPRVFQVKVDNEKLAELSSMGFDEENATGVLQFYNNDMNDAVASVYNWYEKAGNISVERPVPHINDDADEMQMICSVQSVAIDGWTSIFKKKRKNEDKNLAMDDEKKCKTIFDAMHFPLIKYEIFEAWRPLHDQYLKDPSDYDSFKREHANYLKNFERIKLSSNEWRGNFIARPAQKIDRKIEKWNTPRPNSHKLFISITVNGTSVLAFIDTGCAFTTMSLSFAKKCGLESEIDTRYRYTCSGMAGVERICGTIAMCSLGIGGSEFCSSARVMNLTEEITIGEDFFLNHGCIIDMPRNRISINDEVYIEFRSKTQIQKWIASNRKDEDYVCPVLKIDEAKLSELVGMGFEIDRARAVLERKLNEINGAVRRLYFQADEDLEELNENYHEDYKSELALWSSLRSIRKINHQY